MKKSDPVIKRPINGLDFFVLIHASMTCAETKVGWNHVRKTYQTWLRELSSLSLSKSKEHLEDALYAVNMLDEDDKFRHPYGMNFNNFLNKVLRPNERFDKIINVIKEDKQNG